MKNCIIRILKNATGDSSQHTFRITNMKHFCHVQHAPRQDLITMCYTTNAYSQSSSTLSEVDFESRVKKQYCNAEEINSNCIGEFPPDRGTPPRARDSSRHLQNILHEIPAFCSSTLPAFRFSIWSQSKKGLYINTGFWSAPVQL